MTEISKNISAQHIIITRSAIKTIDSLLAKSHFVTTIVDDRQPARRISPMLFNKKTHDDMIPEPTKVEPVRPDPAIAAKQRRPDGTATRSVIDP
jgi:hypothetical protein